MNDDLSSVELKVVAVDYGALAMKVSNEATLAQERLLKILVEEETVRVRVSRGRERGCMK